MKWNQNGPKIGFRERVAQYMQGRYGVDELYKALTWAYLALFILNLFLASSLLYLITLAVIFFQFYRALSKNVEKRRAENVRYLNLRASVMKWFRLQVKRVRECRTHVYRKCPKCKTMLRLPREKGAHTVRCPKCADRFDIKIYF